MKLFFIIILSVISFAQEQQLQLVFSEKMNRAKLFDVKNYTVYDNKLNEIGIHKIGVAQGDSIVVLFLNPLNYKTDYIIRVQNLTDVAGNLIDPKHNNAWFYFDGFDPVNEAQPYLIIK